MPLRLFYGARFRTRPSSSLLTTCQDLPAEVTRYVLELAIFTFRRDSIYGRPVPWEPGILRETAGHITPPDAIPQMITLSSVCSSWAIIIVNSPAIWARAAACASDMETFRRVQALCGNVAFDLSSQLDKRIFASYFKHIRSMEIIDDDPTVDWNAQFALHGPLHAAEHAHIMQYTNHPWRRRLVLHAPSLTHLATQIGVQVHAPNLRSLVITSAGCDTQWLQVSWLTSLLRPYRKLEVLHLDDFDIFQYPDWYSELHGALDGASILELRILARRGPMADLLPTSSAVTLPLAEVVQLSIPMRVLLPRARSLHLADISVSDVMTILSGAPAVVELNVLKRDVDAFADEGSGYISLPCLRSIRFQESLNDYNLCLFAKLRAPELVEFRAEVDLPFYAHAGADEAVLNKVELYEELEHLITARSLFSLQVASPAELRIETVIPCPKRVAIVSFCLSDGRTQSSSRARSGFCLEAVMLEEDSCLVQTAECRDVKSATLAHVLSAFATSRVARLHQSISFENDIMDSDAAQTARILDPLPLPTALDADLVASSVRRMTSLTLLEFAIVRGHERTGFGFFHALHEPGELARLTLPNLRDVRLYTVGRRPPRLAKGVWFFDLYRFVSAKHAGMDLGSLDIRVSLAGNICGCYNYLGSLSRLKKIRRHVAILDLQASTIADSSCHSCL
ncbi:unnamed protein product [Peniophora sp. CBMAI 1063]|nr:unnamed protein product [Peniophora sp. CBMAI 1063]